MDKINKYLIVEEGRYDDYNVYIVKIPDGLNFTNEEIEFLLSLDKTPYDHPSVSGRIQGIVSGFEVRDFKTEAGKQIDKLFCCFDNRKYKSILDREYSADELLEIATANDSSGYEYWKRRIKVYYSRYKDAYKLYLKI